jgi:hypothetical protein
VTGFEDARHHLLMSLSLEKKLASGINYILEGRQTSPNGTKITRKHIVIYSGGDMEGACKLIENWDRQGILKIIKHPNSASDEEFCIELKMFINQKSPIRGWLNWDWTAPI